MNSHNWISMYCNYELEQEPELTYDTHTHTHTHTDTHTQRHTKAQPTHLCGAHSAHLNNIYSYYH